MMVGLNAWGALRLAGMGALALALGACSMGNMLAPKPGATTASADFQNANASPAEISAAATSALPAIATECPPIKVREGGEALFKYADNSKPDPRTLNWQAVIDKQSRNCVVSNGKITLKMGAVGRVLLGPAGNAESAELPLRFAVERDGTALFSEKYMIPVAMAGTQAADWVKVIDNVEIPYLGGEQITIWVGFDPRG
jgi:hypothetical protein